MTDSHLTALGGGTGGTERVGIPIRKQRPDQMTAVRMLSMSLAALAGFFVGAAFGFYAVPATVDWQEALQPQLIIVTVGIGSVVSTLSAILVAPDRSRRWPSMVVPGLVAAVASAGALAIAEAGPVLLILAALCVSTAVVAGAQGTE